MTNKEFAFNYAGKEFMYYGNRVILVGFNSKRPGTVIVSPLEEKAIKPFCWEGEYLDRWDVIMYKTDIGVYQYVNLNEIVPITNEKPQTVVKPMAPGGGIAYYEGQQGMNYSVINGSVSAVYKRQGSALKLVSRGEGINDVTEKV
jgi:hypothetical protein|nr:MAG TPA: hypothetical protein [Caudoviricetes sp.]